MAVDSKSCGMSGSSCHSSSSSPSSSSSSASSVSFPYESSMSSRCGATKNVRRTLRAEEKSPASSSACACGNPRATNASATTEAITADISSGAASLSASEFSAPAAKYLPNVSVCHKSVTKPRQTLKNIIDPSYLCLRHSSRDGQLLPCHPGFSGDSRLF